MNVLDLFSGIGGFSLGLERAGMKTVAFCEINPFCQKVLKKHWPDVPIYEDIYELYGKDITETVDLVCGGYPCQGKSVAGERRGPADDRWLWPQMFRLVREIRPTWLFAENVANHKNMGLDSVLAELEGENYSHWTFIIPACATNAPHKRNRVWIIANSNSGLRGVTEQEICTGWNAVTGGGIVADTVSIRRPQVEQHDGRGKEGKGPICEIGERSFNGRKQDWWKAKPGICRMDDGVPRRVDRLRALGNAVVPQIPEIIGRAIMEIEEKS